MSEHCMINGQRCSKCCEVLTVKESKNFREWRSYVRRYGYPDDYPQGNKVMHMLRKISKRRAKKMNPQLVNRVGRNQSYFTCKNHTDSGCSDYENRPSMCSGYPYYGRTEREWLDSDEYKRGGLYRIDCTYYEVTE